jgi:hypothetical protein
MGAALNDPRRATFGTFSDPDFTTPADPSGLTLYLRDPRDGTVTTQTWPVGSVVRDSTGVFHYDLPDDVSGLWQWRWVATGAVATSSLTGALSVSEAWPPALVGLDDARAQLNFASTTDDDELQGFIYSASALLLHDPAYRVGDAASAGAYTEWADSGRNTVVVKHYPVTDVTSVSEYTGASVQAVAHEPIDGGTFTGNGWDYQDGTGENGILIRLNSSGADWCWRGNRVKVVYTAGSASVPDDIRRATLLIVEHLWEQTQRGGGSGGRPTPQGLPDTPDLVDGPDKQTQAMELLAPYRRAPVVA